MLGVVACLPPHVMSSADRIKAPELNDLFVDIGWNQEEAAAVSLRYRGRA